MRIALYIEDGREQIVLTPQTETERGIVRKLHDGKHTLSIRRGSFYACQGGWTRQGAFGERWQDDDSTIIVLANEPEPVPVIVT